MKTISKIGVFTSGGDSPGMNAAIRAATRTALFKGIEVTGIRYGYQGMIDSDFVDLNRTSVSNIIQRGGTILKCARCMDFMKPEGRKIAYDNIAKEGIDGLVAIGGDGTFKGASIFSQEYGIPIAGVPGTIDNDLSGTDETIGYDTALNTALDAIDKIRDTADAHERLFIVEVMGRDAGFIALETGIAGGAELTLMPETMTRTKEIKEALDNILANKKRSTLIVVAEGDESGGAIELSNILKPDYAKYDMRVCVLGHIQRGGNPTARDRVLASRLGAAAVNALYDGHENVMVGVVNNNIKITPLKSGWSKKKSIQQEILDLVRTLK